MACLNFWVNHGNAKKKKNKKKMTEYFRSIIYLCIQVL